MQQVFQNITADSPFLVKNTLAFIQPLCTLVLQFLTSNTGHFSCCLLWKEETNHIWGHSGQRCAPHLHAASSPKLEAEGWRRWLQLSVSWRALSEKERRIMSILCSPRCKKRHPGNQFVSQFCAVIPSILWFTFYKMRLQTLLCKNNEFSLIRTVSAMRGNRYCTEDYWYIFPVL